MPNAKATIIDFVFYKKFKVLFNLDEDEVLLGIDEFNLEPKKSSSLMSSLIEKN
jgi:hypothetical protein